MTEIVIAFPGRGAGTKRVRRNRQKRSSQITAQVDRIALLLAELDNLMPLSVEVSAGLTQAPAAFSEMEEKLTKRSSGHPAHVAAVEGDPQPYVDHNALEYYFHSLNR